MIQLSRMEKSGVHLELCRALGVTDEPQNRKERARSSFAYWMSQRPSTCREAGLLADALTEHVQHPDFCFLMSELTVAAGDREMARCAGELIGAIHIGRGVWSTAPTEIAPRTSIPLTLLRDYLEEWACHLPFADEPAI